MSVKICKEVLEKHAKTLGVAIETEYKKKANKYCICFHISGLRSGYSNEWFCFSVVLTLPEYKLGIWTRKDMEYHKDSFDVIEKNRIFEPTTFEQWLETWFETAVLEELTRP